MWTMTIKRTAVLLIRIKQTVFLELLLMAEVEVAERGADVKVWIVTQSI